jgi:hypothetical protein
LLSPANNRSVNSSYFSNGSANKTEKKTHTRKKSLGALSEKELEETRSRRSSKGRIVEEDLPESYANLAKRVYAMGEKEGWSQAKII